MFWKIILFLFSTSAVLADNLRDTPEDLRELFKEVDTQVKELQHETMIQIRSNSIPLTTYIGEAKINTLEKLTEAAKPYWNNISWIQLASDIQGKNITVCVIEGNSRLSTLNRLTSGAANETFDYYELIGNNILDSSGTAAYSVIQELIALEQVVTVCHDDTCATELSNIVTQYFERAKFTLLDAEIKASNYVQVYLRTLLTGYFFDSASYAANVGIYLDEVINCVNKV